MPLKPQMLALPFSPRLWSLLFSERDRTSRGAEQMDPPFRPRLWSLFFSEQKRVDGGITDSMVLEFACLSTGPTSFRGLAAVGFVTIAAFLGFTVVVVGSGLNDTCFGSIGAVAAVLEKQPREVHVSTTPRGGTGQLQPIKIAHRAPMKSVLIKFPSAGQNSVRVVRKSII